MDHISQKRYIHVKLIMMMQKEEEPMNKQIWIYTSKNAFNEFNNVVYEDVRLDNFLAIDETHLLLDDKYLIDRRYG